MYGDYNKDRSGSSGLLLPVNFVNQELLCELQIAAEQFQWQSEGRLRLYFHWSSHQEENAQLAELRWVEDGKESTVKPCARFHDMTQTTSKNGGRLSLTLRK